MTRGHAHEDCQYGDDGYAFGPRPEPGYAPGQDQERDQAFKKLAAALESLPDPVTACAKELTAADVKDALESGTATNRNRVLRPLGLNLTPRTIGTALSQDVRLRLLRAGQCERRHAADRLAAPVYTEMMAAAIAPEELASSAADKVAARSAQLARFAVWAGTLPSAAGARILLWAGDQPWFTPEGATSEDVSAVLSAAQAVVDTTAEYDLFDQPRPGDEVPDADALQDVSTEPGPVAPGDPTTSEQDIAISATTTAPADPNPPTADASDETSVAEPADDSAQPDAPTAQEPDASDEPVLTAEALSAVLVTLDATLTAAAAQARDLARTLEDGRPPSQDSLAVLDAALREFETAETHLRAAGASPAERSMHGLRESLDAVTQAQGESAVRAGLDVLESLRAGENPDLQAALTAAVARAQALSSSMLWSASDRAEAEALALVAELATGSPAAEALIAAQDRIATAAPHLALLAIRASALIAAEFATLADTPPAPAPDAEPPVLEPAQPAPQPQTDPARPGGEPASEPAPTTDVAAKSKNFAHPTAHPATEPAPSSQHHAPHPPTVAVSAATQSDSPADQAPASDSPVTEDTQDSERELLTSVTTLVAQGRHALAAEISARCTTPPLDPDLLRASALAAAVRNPHGQVATALHQRVAALDSATIDSDTAALLMSTAAMLRTALVTGEPTAGALLLALQPHLGDELGALASEVGRRAVTGVLVEAPPLTALADATDTERVLAAAQETAQELMRPRRMRFKRASDIVNGWLDQDGLIGSALHAVVSDDRSKLEHVNATIAVLSDMTEVTKSIEVEDRKLRTTSSKALQGSVRNDLISEAVKAVPALSQWADAVASLALADRSARWSTTEVSDMRTAVLAAGTAALDALASRDQDSDPLVVAAAASAHQSLTHTLDLLDGAQHVSAVETPPAMVLGLDALRVRGALVDVVTAAVTLPVELQAHDLQDAIGRSWDDTVRMHVQDENFLTAHHLLRTSEAGMLDDGSARISDVVAALVSSHEMTARSELDWRRSELAAELRNARRNNQIDEEQDAELTAMLRDTELRGKDLAVVRAMLTKISKSLPDFRARAALTLTTRLHEVNDSKVSEQDIERVKGFIASGDLGTAEELIYLLETNEQLPSPRNHEYLKQFFPAVPEALPEGITGSVIEICRDSGTVASCPTLTFTSLSPDQAAQTADALAGWRTLGATPPEKRYGVSETDLLLPALRVAGIEAKKTVQLNDVPRARERRYVDVYEVDINGKAMVPAFGSHAGDRRRILLAWGRPSADTLMSWVDQDPTGEAVIVAYFGTMSAQVRRDMAALTPRSHAPVIVLDDAALAYLAARGDRLLQATMGILLPFAHVNPYVHEKRGLVAREMFYGREKEQRQVIDPNGTQIIYGGRGLGKSALLRDAEDAFERSSPAPGSRVAVYLSLDTLQIGSGKARSAEALWDGLLSELTRREVIPAKGASRAGKAHAKVVAGINTWLEADTSRRLLILLDESDRFFESDSPEFGETSRLRNLGTTTRDRAKVVFAGLHSVQRFTKVAGNGPFSHLAQRPTVIGPLKPQSALNLLTEPMAAMGYEFAEPDLVNRVLANCSYQPFLLQMFGHRLVEHMHERRRELGVQLPYIVTRADIESVETNEELREDISTAFRDTLNLDPRYNVIANVMARNAHESGLEARLTDTELREDCLQWWEDGFTELDTAAFRSYLNEMVGLGVLARNGDGRGWRLRGPAVLNMVGSPSDVENQLLGADTESLREDFVALASRTELADGRFSPLTAAQVDDLLGDHSIQVRVVMGSRATGIQDVAGAVKEACQNGFAVLEVNSRGAFEAALTAGDPGARRVVISDLSDFTADLCAATLRAAVDQTPDRPGVTRSVVLVTGAHQMPFWRSVMDAQPETASLGTVTLSRHDVKTLRVWTMTAQRFRAPERTDRLLAVTGGWPFLLERAAAKARSASREPSALDDLEKYLSTTEGAVEVVDAVGLRLDPMVQRGYGDLVTMLGQDSADLAELHVAAGESTTDPEAVVACLQSLGAFERVDKGQYRLEPVLAHAWSLVP